MENLTNEEKDYYELLVDLLENGEISDSERNILNKRKEKYSISDSRASEIEEFAKQERLQNLKPQNDSETSYYELILDFMENGNVSESNRKILNKRLEKYGITEARAKELEYFAKQEYLESKKVKFESEEEKEYYEFVFDLMENGAISENSRKILDKRKIKFGISETRAKELEEFAKSNNSGNSNDLLEEGKTYCNNEEYDKAIEIFKKAVELNPNDDDSWRLLGNSYNRNGQIEEAIKYYLKAAELNPDDSRNWFNLGISYSNNEQYKEAINSFLKVVELNPDDSYSWYGLGNSYIKNKQVEDAIKSLLKATELNSNDYQSWLDLAISYIHNEQYEEAIKYLSKAKELNPDGFDNWYELGEAYLNNGQFQEAIETLLKAVELNPDEDIWRLLGMSYRFNEQYEEAMNSFIEATKLNQDNNINWYAIGDLLYIQGAYEEATEYLKKSIELGNNGLNAWELLGNAYSELENYPEAVECYDYILNSGEFEFNIDFAIKFGINYGVALAYLNRTDEAIEMHMQVLDLDPDNETAKNNLQILQPSNKGTGTIAGTIKENLATGDYNVIDIGILQSSNEGAGTSSNGIVSRISKGIDTVNELSGKIDPKTIGLITGAVGLVGKILGGSNKDKY